MTIYEDAQQQKKPRIHTTDALEIVTISWPEVATEVWEGVASHKQESYCFKSFFFKMGNGKSFIGQGQGGATLNGKCLNCFPMFCTLPISLL